MRKKRDEMRERAAGLPGMAIAALFRRKEA